MLTFIQSSSTLTQCDTYKHTHTHTSNERDSKVISIDWCFVLVILIAANLWISTVATSSFRTRSIGMHVVIFRSKIGENVLREIFRPRERLSAEIWTRDRRWRCSAFRHLLPMAMFQWFMAKEIRRGCSIWWVTSDLTHGTSCWRERSSCMRRLSCYTGQTGFLHCVGLVVIGRLVTKSFRRGVPMWLSCDWRC